MQSCDVVIIGGGIIGCSIAYQLGKRGVRVIVLEQDTIGAQASSAATGLLAPYKLFAKVDDPRLTLQRQSLALFPSLIAELEELTGIDSEYEETGSLRLAPLPQFQRLDAWRQAWRVEGVYMKALTAVGLQSYEPAIKSDTYAAVAIPEPQLCAPAYMRAMKNACEVTEVKLISQGRVFAFSHTDSRVYQVHTAKDTFACAQLVIAAGAWSAHICEILGLSIDVRPQVGTSIEVAQPNPPVHSILFGEGIYIAPKCDERLIIGSTHEEKGFDTSVTAESVSWLLERARTLLPGLAECSVLRAWAGVRPVTPDKHPIIGHAPAFENVWLATGHGGFGVLLSARTGMMIADQIEASLSGKSGFPDNRTAAAPSFSVHLH